MPLDKAQLREIESSLDRQYVALLEGIREELGDSEQHRLTELVGRGGVDRGEEAVGDMLAELNVATFDRHINELRELEAARVRLREAALGVCEDCGEDIPFARLQVQPVAIRCVDCQDKHDRMFAHARTPRM